MKRFYAIILALALLLGYASVASADFSFAGQFVVEGVYNADNEPAWGGFDYSGDTRFELKFTATYGNVSGDLKYRFRDADLSDPNQQLRTANMFYKFSDALSLGLSYDITGDLQVHESLVDSEWDWEYDFGVPVLRANITSGDLMVSVVTDLFNDDMPWSPAPPADQLLWLYGGATYNLDPLTIACGIAILDDEVTIFPGVKYAISDELSVDGELYYEVESEYTLVGAGVNYATDAAGVEAGFFFDLSDGATEDIAYYFVYAFYRVTDNIELYLNYFDPDYTFNPAGYDPGFEVGATIYLNENEKTYIDINYLEDSEDLTFAFVLKF